MEERIRISAVYNGCCTAAEGDAVLDLRPVYEQKTADALEYPCGGHKPVVRNRRTGNRARCVFPGL